MSVSLSVWSIFFRFCSFTRYVEQKDTATTLHALCTTEVHMAPASSSASDINSAKSTHIYIQVKYRTVACLDVPLLGAEYKAAIPNLQNKIA